MRDDAALAERLLYKFAICIRGLLSAYLPRLLNMTKGETARAVSPVFNLRKLVYVKQTTLSASSARSCLQPLS